MGIDVGLLARLLSHGRGRATIIASHLRVVIRSDAVVLCPIALAGEDATIHIAALGRIGKAPRILCVPDPRSRDAQFRLFKELGAELESYFRVCLATGTYPQMWVSSAPALQLLDTVADRIRWCRGKEEVRRFGECLAHATERHSVAGQQALHLATEVLLMHWTTGQQEGEDQHLGALLTWIDPPLGLDIHDAVALAEGLPMGVKTAPEFDRNELYDRIRAFHLARKRGANPEALAARADDIRAALEPIAVGIYRATQRSIDLLQGMSLPPLPGLDWLEEREAREFARFMDRLDGDRREARRDKPKTAVIKMAIREDAVRNHFASVLCGDSVGYLEGMLNGYVVCGVVARVVKVPIGARREDTTLDLRSTQRVLRVRRLDELFFKDDPRICMRVIDVVREGQSTTISLRITRGLRLTGAIRQGMTLDLVSEKPDWGWLGRKLNRIKNRLEELPWTHVAGSSLQAPPGSATPMRTPPPDPLAAVEALRAGIPAKTPATAV